MITALLSKPPAMGRGAIALFFATALFSGAGGCRQSLNDRCQIDSDCEDGLFCQLAGNTRATGGTCRPNGTSTGVDLSMQAPDLTASPPDLTLQDLPPADAGDMTGDAK